MHKGVALTVRKVRVATVSFRTKGEPGARLAEALKYVDEAGRFSPDIIVLPETAINDRFSPQPMDGPIVRAMSERALSFGCYLICPFLLRDEDGTLRNIAALIDPNGKVVGQYRKMFPTIREMKDGVVPGDSAPTFQTPFGRIGMAICFDLNFEQVIKELAAGGAEVVFFVSAYEGGRQLERWALDYSVFIVLAHKGGRGCFIDPSGYVLQRGDPYYQPVVVRDLNLNRKILHIDDNWRKMKDVFAKYGDALHADVYTPEGIFALESREPGLLVEDVMREFGLISFHEYLRQTESLRGSLLTRRGST